MLGFLFGLLAGMLTLASAFGGFIVGLIASGAFTEDEEVEEDDADMDLFPESP